MIPNENIPGKYYVDSRCIGCSICSEIAPNIYATNHDEGYEYVLIQPCSKAEEKLCREVMDLCPVNAIGIRANNI